MSTASEPILVPARVTLDHYEHMVECGAFGYEYETKNIELLRGRILERQTGNQAKFTLDHYEHMVRMGAFDPPYDIPVEFLHGEIVMMSPIGPSHSHYLRLLTEWSYEVVPSDRIAVHVQSPIRLPSDGSEPQPDLVWTIEKDYSQRHPEPDEILLIVEIAESSLAIDRGPKLATYVAASIPEYWIVNLLDKQIEVYRTPQGSSYRESSIYQGEDAVQPLVLSTASLSPARLFT